MSKKELNKKDIKNIKVVRYNIYMIEELYVQIIKLLLMELSHEKRFVDEYKTEEKSSLYKMFNTPRESWSRCKNHGEITKNILNSFQGHQWENELNQYILGEKILIYHEEYPGIEDIGEDEKEEAYHGVVTIYDETRKRLEKMANNIVVNKSKNEKGAFLMARWIYEQLVIEWDLRINDDIDGDVIKEVLKFIKYLSVEKLERIKPETLDKICKLMNRKYKDVSTVYNYRKLIEESSK